MIWCVFGGYGGIANFLSGKCDPRHCGPVAHEIGRLAAGMAGALFLVAAWMLWKRSGYLKNYGTIIFVSAMVLNMIPVAIGFAAIRPPEMIATVAAGLGEIVVFGFFLWLWIRVSRERLA